LRSALMAVTNAPARESPGRHITHGRGFFLGAEPGSAVQICQTR
jgi:hypothetical protein